MLLEKGTYHAVMGSSVTSESSGGSLQLAIAMMLTHIAKDRKWLEIQPAERTLFINLSDKSRPYAKKKLKALGFNNDFVDPNFTVAEFDVICDHEIYQNKDRERWELASWGGMEQEPAAEDKVRRLNAIWKSEIASPATVAGRPTTPPASRVAAPAVGRPAAPARPAPASRAPAPAPVAETSTATAEYTKDDAWAAFCAAMNNEPDLTKWKVLIESQIEATGKQESDFDSDDWGVVANKAAAPF